TEHELYDVIVVGAGYCGLTAARDAALSGLKVLLLEARDRIGGRSWSSNIEGYPFEMGGTWRSRMITFAINFFEEAYSTGRLSYAFNTPVASINDDGSGVQAIARDGRIFKASRLISAIPMNILKDVTFSPPLAAGKLDASTTEHVNKCVKVHAEVRDRDLRSWSGITYPNNSLMYAIGDGTTPSGNTHIVAFGGQHNHMQPEKDIDKTMDALKTLTPMDIERVVFHNWADDEFAKGAWFFSPPGLVTEHLEDLRAPQGNMYFANSDWAVGWRSFIDGAIEEGTRAALAVKRDLDRSRSQHL
ncbi:monoamine oxidase N, partial [Aureobasidium pullulans]